MRIFPDFFVSISGSVTAVRAPFTSSISGPALLLLQVMAVYLLLVLLVL